MKTNVSRLLVFFLIVSVSIFDCLVQPSIGRFTRDISDLNSDEFFFIYNIFVSLSLFFFIRKEEGEYFVFFGEEGSHGTMSDRRIVDHERWLLPVLISSAVDSVVPPVVNLFRVFFSFFCSRTFDVSRVWLLYDKSILPYTPSRPPPTVNMLCSELLYFDAHSIHWFLIHPHAKKEKLTSGSMFHFVLFSSLHFLFKWPPTNYCSNVKLWNECCLTILSFVCVFLVHLRLLRPFGHFAHISPTLLLAPSGKKWCSALTGVSSFDNQSRRVKSHIFVI